MSARPDRAGVPHSSFDGDLPQRQPGSRRRGAELAVSFLAGLVFAAGLVLSGMTQPERVIGFLDLKEMFHGPFPGHWNYSLGLVMGGAVAVTLVAFFVTPRASTRPWFSPEFVLPRRERVDGRLILGALIFGLGWGMSGYCPGPALASLLRGQLDTVLFVAAMLPGMYLARKL